MATYNLPGFTNGKAPGRKFGGAHEYVYKWDFTAAIAANDVVNIVRLPKDAVLLGGFIETSADFDTSTNLTISLRVTDGTTTKTLISASTLGQGAAGVVTETAGNGSLTTGWRGFKTENDDYKVQLLFPAGPSTATSGSIYVGIKFSMDSGYPTRTA